MTPKCIVRVARARTPSTAAAATALHPCRGHPGHPSTAQSGARPWADMTRRRPHRPCTCLAFRPPWAHLWACPLTCRTPWGRPCPRRTRCHPWCLRPRPPLSPSLPLATPTTIATWAEAAVSGRLTTTAVETVRVVRVRLVPGDHQESPPPGARRPTPTAT